MITPDPRLDEDLQDLVRSLCARLDEAILVPFVEVSADNWAPAEHECHDNAAVWARSVPGTVHVFGFLHFPMSGRFNAHSVIQHTDGVLYDITPSRASMRYPFIRHNGSDDLFAKAGAVGILMYR